VSTGFRTALVGVGRMGATYADDPLTKRHYRHASHAEVLAAHPAFAWEAVVDPDAPALAQARARWGIVHGSASIEDLLVDYDPEILVLATPPSAYASIVKACPGVKAVLCEKPLGRNLAEAQALLEFCDARGILLQVNYWRRGDPLYRRFAAGELCERVGPPQAISGVYGNGLVNNGGHLVDLCRMLFGEITGVSAFGFARRKGELALEGDFDVSCALRFACGAEAALLPLAFGHYREIGLDVWGETGRLELFNEGLTTRLARRSPHRALVGAAEICVDAPESLTSTVGDALFQIYENLAAALHGRETLVSPGTSAWRTAVVIDAILRSAESGDGRMHALSYDR